MLNELIQEELQAKKDFYNALKVQNAPKLIATETCSDCDNEIFVEAVERSRKALQESQAIESLDLQLRRITETIDGLGQIKRIKDLETKILEEKNFAALIPLITEWRTLTQTKQSQQSQNVKSFINDTLPDVIEKEIDCVLQGWIDDPPKSLDQESYKLLQTTIQANPNNPLPALFSSFPLGRLRVLLGYQIQLGNLQRIKRTYPDRLLNRFYDILSQGQASLQPFSVGLIESLVSEKMKFATRISCLLEGISYFMKLHAHSVSEAFDISGVLMEKCCQILRQIRRDAKSEHCGYSGELSVPTPVSNNVPFTFDTITTLFATNTINTTNTTNTNNLAQIDAQLNEICLIISSLSSFTEISGLKHELLQSELEKWELIHCQLEEVYLYKGIHRAIEMDQIVVTSDYPVSSCVDDIFYLLKGSLKRTHNQQRQLEYLVPRALKEIFLSVLKKHLQSTIQSLKPIQSFDFENFKPSRDLISTLVLINNLITIKSYWRQGFTHSNPEILGIDTEIENLLKFALYDGLYVKVLKKEIISPTISDGQEMFIKIHSNLKGIYTLLKSSLAKEGLKRIFTFSLTDFSQEFCKFLLENAQRSRTTTTDSLRYDRLLHELTQWLESTIGHVPNEIPGLVRLRQLIALLLVEGKSEAAELVDEWKSDNTCQLRAGEILLILNGL